jgi:YVTN family beta-propeller protein
MKYNTMKSNVTMSVLLVAMLTGLTACGNKDAAVEAVSEMTAPSGVAYITSQKSDNAGVSVIDLATMQVVKTFDVKAEAPRGLGITDDGTRLVVATRENQSIAVIDTATGEVVKVIEVGKNPEFVRVKGNFAFISSEPSAVGGPPKRHAEGEEEEADDDDDDSIPAKIAVVDLVKGEKIFEITGGPETEGIEFTADGENIIITNEADNTVTVHNIKSGELVKSISTSELGKRPRGIKVSPDGSTYLATLEWGNKFMVMDNQFNVVRTVDTGKTPYGIAYNNAGDKIYVAANKAKLLQVFDAKTYEKVGEVETGKRCWHFTFTPDDKQILLACGKSESVYVIDAEKLEVTSQIPVPDMPWGLVTYPKSMGSLDNK